MHNEVNMLLTKKPNNIVLKSVILYEAVTAIFIGSTTLWY